MAFTRPKAAQIDFDVTNISDPLIRLNSGQSGSADKDVGIVVERGSDTNVAIIWDESADQFVLVNTTENGSTSGNVTISSYAGLQANAIVYGSLNDGTTTLTATTAELNYLDGVTGITLGSANELLIVGSDGTSIISDSTLSIDTGSNYIGINQSSPEVTLHMTGEGAQTAQIRMEQYNDSADAPDLRTRRYRGTIASPSAVQSGDYLYRSNHEYWNGSALIVGGTFAFDNTNNANRTQFAVSVTTDGTSADANTPSKVQFKIDGNDSGAITFNNAYKFPTSDGSANQVLQTDGSGALSFASISSTINLAGDSGTDAYTTGSTLTFSGTANEITTAVTDDTVTISLPDNVTIGQDLTVTGNLTVSGTTTTISTTNSVVSDSLIELNTGAASNANDLGIVMERGSTGDNAAIIWDESADKFVVGTTTATGASTGDLTVTTGTLVANIEGNVTGNITGDVTGNADTATALATARNIAGQSFDGTGDITIASTDLSDTSNLVRNNQNNTITSTTAGSSAAPEFELFRDITGADANYIGQIKFSADNDADQKTVFAKITGKIGDASDGTEDGIIEIAHIKAGSQNINVRMTSTEFKILNGTDFDIETHDGSSAGLRLNNTLVTATAAELNILDGVTATASELNIIDGDTSATSTTLADADRVVVNDAGTMKQVALTDFETYFETALDTLSNVTSVGTLNGLAVASTQTISLGSNRVQNVADPVGNQDAATKAYVDANAGSGGGSSGFTASTTTTAPGSDGDFDLSFNVAQDTQETPFESGGSDAFGVSLGEVYDQMEPVGSTSSVDLGVLT